MWPNPQFAGLVTFTEEILDGKLHFLCSEGNNIPSASNVLHAWLSVTRFAVGKFLVNKSTFTVSVVKFHQIPRIFCTTSSSDMKHLFIISVHGKHCFLRVLLVANFVYQFR